MKSSSLPWVFSNCFDNSVERAGALELEAMQPGTDEARQLSVISTPETRARGVT